MHYMALLSHFIAIEVLTAILENARLNVQVSQVIIMIAKLSFNL